MQIIALIPENQQHFIQAAGLLVDAFENAWPSFEEALAEVRKSRLPGCVSLVAVDAGGRVVGFAGARPCYGRNVWELHPLAVAPGARRQGVGRALVQAVEAEAAARGGLTMMLGTDDESQGTSLGGIDIYPHLLENISRITNLKNHPYEFYLKLGYAIVGVIPDANGFGKPDILMAKRIRKQ